MARFDRNWIKILDPIPSIAKARELIKSTPYWEYNNIREFVCSVAARAIGHKYRPIWVSDYPVGPKIGIDRSHAAVTCPGDECDRYVYITLQGEVIEAPVARVHTDVGHDPNWYCLWEGDVDEFLRKLKEEKIALVVVWEKWEFPDDEGEECYVTLFDPHAELDDRKKEFDISEEEDCLWDDEEDEEEFDW